MALFEEFFNGIGPKLTFGPRHERKRAMRDPISHIPRPR
jgi:hypothetical protein